MGPLLNIALIVSAASGTAAPFKMEGRSSAEQRQESHGGRVFHTVNTTFHFIQILDGKEFRPVLLEQRLDITSRTSVDGVQSQLTVIAWDGTRKAGEVKLWTIQDDADEGYASDDLYITTKHGCCGAENTLRVYNIRTGKLMLMHTGALAKVDVPNSPLKRWVGFHGRSGSVSSPEMQKGTDVVGVLTIAREDGTSAKVVCTAGKGSWWTPEVLLVNDREPRGTKWLQLWTSNGQKEPTAMTGFSVKLNWEEASAVIPVQADGFNLQAAVLPAGMVCKSVGP